MTVFVIAVVATLKLELFVALIIVIIFTLHFMQVRLASPSEQISHTIFCVNASPKTLFIGHAIMALIIILKVLSS
jgi:hypothetical protein